MRDGAYPQFYIRIFVLDVNVCKGLILFAECREIVGPAD
jgi:hypothetical protein